MDKFLVAPLCAILKFSVHDPLYFILFFFFTSVFFFERNRVNVDQSRVNRKLHRNRNCATIYTRATILMIYRSERKDN